MTRAAAYCRVSTDGHDQINSFESQKIFFVNYIENRPGWTLAGIYADEGITGTSTTNRTDFLKMIDDAHRGIFDVILTKEVSRFSRNILDAVAYTRELRSVGVTVIFLNDGISTADPDAELRLGIMASVAQEESRKISERVKWGQQRRMERGIVFGRSLLGYDVRGGKISVEPKGAEMVRLIFDSYLRENKGVRSIAAALTSREAATRSGATIWSGAAVLKILRNEKYCGDLIQRKSITTDYLTHKKKYNRGDAALICQRDHHEPIVSRETWEAVQRELSRRSANGGGASRGTRYALSGRITCGTCGAVYRCRTRKRKDGTSYRVWVRQCGCVTEHRQIREDALENCIRCFVGHLGADVLLRGFDDILMRIEGMAGGGVLAVKKDISLTEAKLSRLAGAYIEGEVGREAYLALKGKYDSKLKTLESRLNERDANKSDIETFLAENASGRGENGTFYLDLVKRTVVKPVGGIDIVFHDISEPLCLSVNKG